MAEPQNKSDNNPKSVYESLNGIQKSAILMMLLGEEEAAEIIKNLGPKEVQSLGAAMYSVQGLGQDTVNEVLDEFLYIIKQQTSLGLGAGNYIKNVLNRAIGEERAQSVLSRISPSDSQKPIEILDWMDGPSIADLILDEHPQIIALIISYLDSALGADVLNLLPDEMQADVIARIANLDTVGPDALAELEDVMQKKFKANTSLRATQVGGVKAGRSNHELYQPRARKQNHEIAGQGR
jgi:flagellar motor switch protein FliG